MGKRIQVVRVWTAAVSVTLALWFAGVVSAQDGPRVLLIYDMEGVTDVVRSGAVSFSSPMYAAARESLTDDVNAAIRGLLEAGASEVVLTDGHGSGNPEPDYLIARLPEGARHDIRDVPYDPYVDATTDEFDAVVAIGMHGRAGGGGFLSHTYYGHTMWVMGEHEMNETMLLAASAARFDIPVILVTGDDVLQQEVAAFSPETEYVVVKQAISRRQAEPRGRNEVSADIQAAARRAIERLSSIPPWNPPTLSGPFENYFSFTLSVHAALAMNFPGVWEINRKTVALRTDGFLDAYLAYRALANFTALAPLRTIFEAIPAEEGGPELLQRVRGQLADQMRPGFTQTDEPIDEELFAMFTARTRYGYR